MKFKSNQYPSEPSNSYAVTDELLGMPGAMLSGIKQVPPGREDHTIYWNACVFQDTGKGDAFQIWHGDLDVTEKTDKLQECANRVGTTIYVTKEQPWRFQGFKRTMESSYDAEQVITFEPQ